MVGGQLGGCYCLLLSIWYCTANKYLCRNFEAVSEEETAYLNAKNVKTYLFKLYRKYKPQWAHKRPAIMRTASYH